MKRGTLTRAIAGIGAAAAATSLAVVGSAVSAGAASSTAPATVTVTMTKQIVRPDTQTVQAGAIEFVAKRGDHHQHTLVVASLAKGFSLNQANHDVNAAFGGDVKAVRTIDKKIHWYGGTDAPGRVVVNLSAGKYYLLDEDGNGLGRLTVTGPKADRTVPASSATVFAAATTHGFGFKVKGTIAHDGWVTFSNKTDEPHFMEIQQVKPSTTRAYVRKHIQDRNQPAKILKAGQATAPVGPGKSVLLKLHLPKGKYLIACFWPSRENGMPHAFMGMYKLVHIS